jgi:hypothetical protein
MAFGPGSSPRVAPPCSPDGACIPRRETWGWYQTRWRTFPGDVLGKPTEPQGPPEGVQPGDEIRGPQLPPVGEEGLMGPRGGPRAGGAPAPGIEGAAPDTILPPVEGAPTEGQPAAEPGVEPEPDAIPDLEPFGAAPPQAPAWLIDAVGRSGNVELPAVDASPSNVDGELMPAGVTEPTFDGPNLHGDDAPPALPQALRRTAAGMSAASAAATHRTVLSVPATLLQPTSVRPVDLPPADRGIVTASAERPLGIALINPAAAVAVAPEGVGLQQAIYYEATDVATDEDDSALAQ